MRESFVPTESSDRFLDFVRNDKRCCSRNGGRSSCDTADVAWRQPSEASPTSAFLSRLGVMTPEKTNTQLCNPERKRRTSPTCVTCSTVGGGPRLRSG